MEKLEVTRNAQTDQFSVVLSRGNDTIRCMVTVDTGRVSSTEEKHRAALSKAKALAKALDSAIKTKSLWLAAILCRVLALPLKKPALDSIFQMCSTGQ